MATAFTSALHPNNRPTQTSANQASWQPRTDHGEHHAQDDMNGNGDDGTDDDDDDYNDEFSHTNGHAYTNGHPHLAPFPPRFSSLTQQDPMTAYDPPDPTRSPFALALHAIFLSAIFTSSLLSLAYIYFRNPSNPLWRVPFFAYLLSQFHLLEYLVTAYHNPSAATTAAFLLDNGRAYTVAHVCAFIECTLHWSLFEPISNDPPSISNRILTFPLLPIHSRLYILTGLVMLIVGQTVRTAAMAHAGANFTHLVASHKLPHHILVTDGPYRYLRHPSYFGFFWWGVGGQMVLGNSWCLVGYVAALWQFFFNRVSREEGYLVGFFGQEYEEYRARTWVGIPFV